MTYTALVGKPYEISFQYAEMVANKMVHAHGRPPIERMYFIGYVIYPSNEHFASLSFSDNPEVDIVGANIYNALLQKSNISKDSYTNCGLLTHPRLLSAKSCESILVCTGVYVPNVHKINTKQAWTKPTTIQLDVADAVHYILSKEKIL